MKLATLRNGTRDGQLLVVSSDLRFAVPAAGIADTLLGAIESWDRTAPRLVALSVELERGRAASAIPFDPQACTAPLPRTWQWLDASAFPNHGELMWRAFGHAPIENAAERPLMYQGGSDDFSVLATTCPCRRSRTASTSRRRSPSSSIACRWARLQRLRSRT